MIVFTFVAFFHVRTQPHIVRTGTRVLGGMGRDLRCRKTQVVTASVWLGAELTGIWSCSRMEEKTSHFSHYSFLALGKEISDPLKRLSHTPYPQFIRLLNHLYSLYSGVEPYKVL